MLYGTVCIQQQLVLGKYLLSKMDYIVEQANKINGQASKPEKEEEPDYTRYYYIPSLHWRMVARSFKM